jgi:hypothetical protein
MISFYKLHSLHNSEHISDNKAFLSDILSDADFWLFDQKKLIIALFKIKTIISSNGEYFLVCI